MEERFCPLCETSVAALRCARHDVPTLAASNDGHPRPFEVGTVLIGRYRVNGLLTHGGMGALLDGTSLEDGRRLIIKVLKASSIQSPAHVRRFYQEGRAARGLIHDNIVRIVEFGIDDAIRAPFLAMEFAPGRTLKALLQEEGPLSELRAAGLFAQVVDALDYAHARSILHRDLKPSNVIVHEREDGTEHARVLDFGLAKILAGDETIAPLTEPGRTVGTPAYMSPEQVVQGEQDFRTDLYGLGCMLHAALTGAPPFVGEDAVEIMKRHWRAQPPPLPRVLSDGRTPSERLVHWHARLLSKRKEDRAERTAEVAEAFRSLEKSAASTEAPTRPTRIPAQDTVVDSPAIPASVSNATEIVDRPAARVRSLPPPPAPTVRMARSETSGATHAPLARQATVKVTPVVSEPNPGASTPSRIRRLQVVGLLGVILATALAAWALRFV